MLIKKQVARVVYGYQDPNPIVDGQGHEKLIAAGIICDYRPLPEAQAFYESYAYWHKHKRPFLTAKLAVSADGKIAGEGKRPVKMTGELTNQFTHLQRKMSDAILTSVKTIIQDDPELNVRLGENIQSKPIYILDRSLQFPLFARVMQTAQSITVFHDKKLDAKERLPFTKHNILCVPIPCHEEKLDLECILDYLGKQGLHDIWLEAGAILFNELVERGLAQRVYLYHAPCLLGKTAYPAGLSASFKKKLDGKSSFFLGMDQVILIE